MRVPLVGSTRLALSTIVAVVVLATATFPSGASARSADLDHRAPLVEGEVEMMPADDLARSQRQGPRSVRLKSRTIETGPQNASVLPDAASPRAVEARGQQERRRVAVVQLSTRVTQIHHEAIEALGASIDAYVPDDSLQVRATPQQLAAIRRLADVSWIGHMGASDKIAADVGVEPSVYEISVGDATAEEIRGLIDAAGATALDDLSVEVAGSVVLVHADATELAQIAASPLIDLIEPLAGIEARNESAAGAIVGTTKVNANGYDGSGQVVGVIDSGLGDGTAAGAHGDIPASRIKAIYDWPGIDNGCLDYRPDGPVDVGVGHGTHVVGSVLGGGRDDGVGRGAAPGARLVMQTVEDPAYVNPFCDDVPFGYYFRSITSAGLTAMLAQAYDAGARIHNNSWGSSGGQGSYTQRAAAADAFVFNNTKMTVVFAAGNDGVDLSPSDGSVDADSIGPPATAKNVITVGASENARDDYACDVTSDARGPSWQLNQTCAEQGGENILGTGAVWQNRYPVAPLRTDERAGNSEQMAVFSGRGPTDDGRIKPDVVAPGTWVLSTSSAETDFPGWGLPADDEYKYLGGTSMAAPIVSGVAAVLRDFYLDTDGHHATAALVKATLINSAVDLLDENNDGLDDNAFPIPNIHEGWGRVDAQAATDRSHVYKDRTNGLVTGQQVSYTYDSTGGAPFKATLVWSDAPGSTVAASSLVNNLDLLVIAPDGTTYRGNNFSGGWSLAAGAADTVNNVENVFVATAQAGLWKVTIQAPNVPVGPQPFALVVDNPTGFSCQADGGVLTWSQANQPKYWTYKSTDGGNTFTWLGKTDGTTTLTDRSAAPGTMYQVHYQGIPRALCTVVAEPPDGPAFSCEVDAGALSWTDDGQPKYWMYRSTDGGLTYAWLGKTLGQTSYTDPNPVIGAKYQVHYQGLARVECTVINEPSASAPVFSCQATNGVLTWTDADQGKYWTYRSTDGGATYVWLGKTEGAPAATTLTDTNWTNGTLYQVHYQGIPRSSCS